MPVIQPLPAEIQEQVDRQLALIAQCDGEIVSLQKALDNWTAQRQAAQAKVGALKAKYGKPNLEVWPAEVEAIL